MTTEVEKFDPSTLMEGVKNRIKATFVSLIPDAQWEQMCQQQINQFTKRRPGQYSNSEPTPSEFENLAYEILRDFSKERIEEGIKKYQSANYGSYDAKINDLVQTMLIEKSSEIFAAMFGSMFQYAINEMKRRNY
jgi:hypothetical protein